MSMTSFREAVAAMLSAELGIDFVPGRIEGPVEGKDLGCTFPLRVSEEQGFIQQQNLFVGVRVFKAARTRQSPSKAFDPAPLEELAEQIQLALAKHQTGYGAWFQRVTEIEFDSELRMVEAAVLGVQQNPAL